MASTHEVLVLRRGIHGIDMADYAAALERRLPDTRVRHATTPEEERDLVADASVVTGIEFDPELLDHAEALELFCAGSAGVDHLPLSAFERHGVAVTSASGVHGPNVAEHVVGSILSFVRRFDEARERMESREWRHYQVDELAGSTVAVVGLGAIGTAVVERLKPFDVETLGVRHSPEKGGPTDEVFGFESASLDEALARAEYVVLACPLTETTTGLIGAAEFATLPPDAVLVNVARGPVVDTAALVDALRRNDLRGAALDVTDPEPLPEDHPLWSLSNVLITPHNAGHTPRYVDRLADIVAENVGTYAATGSTDDLRNLVS